ncbi:DNA helicase [Azospirillum palustre]|uniref:DNA helicase n=1 Tax=Azospirillum palustre TaxID=2044885 RepID=A0A2B8BFN7_9PROT|nr:DUF927 domain-containing protein [Azospirillum palustre]PGH56519.1 DNA helicase [Azospirillum palustre]
MMPDDNTSMFTPLTPDEVKASRATGLAKGADKVPILPVPDNAPQLRFKHPKYGEPSRTWPYRDAAGRLLGYAARFDFTASDGTAAKDVLPLTFCDLGNGKRGWRSKGIPDPRPLYKLPELIARPDALVIVTEGEKAADAAAELLPERITTTPMHGAKSPHKTDWSPVKGREVVIWPDHDEPGASFAQAVAELATKAGAASVRVVKVPADWPPGWDLADEPPAGVTVETLRAMIEAAGPWEPPPKAPAGQRRGMPPEMLAFVMRDYGLYHRDPDTGDTLLSGPFEVVAETRDSTGGSWGVLLAWKDPDGRRHEWAMPRSILAGDGTEFRRVFLDGGLFVAPGRKARDMLMVYLANVRAETYATCVDRTGWHGRVYVSATRTYGDTQSDPVILQGVTAAADTKPRGTLEGWQDEVAALAIGNSRLAFALSAAFAGPLLYLLNAESGGLHFRGASSIGKSSMLNVAASAWGCPVYNWRATDNAAEALARAANDALLCLDELGQADGRAADAMGYMLSNGAGKARMAKDTSARPVMTWRMVFVSTGEIGLAEKVAEAGRRTRAGQEIRILDIPADAGAGLGAFEALHGSIDGDAFSRRLRLATETHRGHAAHAFLERITASDLDELSTAVRAGGDRWKAEHLPAGADGQVQRAAGRFALIAAAGELAATMGVLPWPDGEASRAAAACFTAWINARGGKGPAEVTAGIAQVRGFLEAHGMSRFEPAWETDATGQPVESRTINRVGFRRKDALGQWEFYAMAEGFKEMAKGFNSKELAAELVKAGMLAPAGNGKSSKPVKVPNVGPLKLYHFTPAALAGGDDDA